MMLLRQIRFLSRPKFVAFAAILIGSLWLTCSTWALDRSSADTPKPVADRLHWWQEDRFGMFIHYGPVTLTGQEISWSRANSNPHCPNKGPIPVDIYDNLYKRFDPVDFHASDWTGAAKSAGMKYIVLTVKHCDGFLLWDSKVDGYNIMASPFKRDLAGELASAARQDGLRLGWYFSPMDWRDPDFRSATNAVYLQRMRGELREILSRYGNIDLLWFDYDGGEPVYDQASTYRLVRQLQPAIIINNRLDLSTEPNEAMRNPNADYYTPEQRIGAYDDQRPWETCMTLGTQWSWKPEDKIKSAAEVVSILARVAGGDGNLLLDVGPMPDGRIEPRQLSVLESVGTWMRRNSESIYGTRGGPWKPNASLASTRKGKTIYVHVLTWPSGSLVLPEIPAKVLSAETMDGKAVRLQRTTKGIEIELDPIERDAFDTVVALRINKDAMRIPAQDLVQTSEAPRP